MIRKKDAHPDVEAKPGAEAPDPPASDLAAELERARAREDELLRAVAELTNVNRRRKQEMDTIVQYAEEDLVRNLLPVLDDLDRALQASKDREHDSLGRGVALVRERLWKVLEKEGLEEIDAMGKPFDPELSEAVAQAPSDRPVDTVVEVVARGYKFKGRVIRHAQVVVARAGEEVEP